jgi:hypothetical protein
MGVPRHESLVDDVRAFARELGERYTFVDLRAAEIGMGFSLGRYGPRREVCRHGFERLFAHASPQKKPDTGRPLAMDAVDNV